MSTLAEWADDLPASGPQELTWDVFMEARRRILDIRTSQVVIEYPASWEFIAILKRMRNLRIARMKARSGPRGRRR